MLPMRFCARRSRPVRTIQKPSVPQSVQYHGQGDPMNRITALLLLVPAAFAQSRPRTGEYALILNDPPVAEVAQSRIALSGTAAAAHRTKLAAAQTSVLAELGRRKIVVHRTFSILTNAVYVKAAGTDPAALAAIPGVKRVQYLPPVHRDLAAAVNLINAPAAWGAVGGPTNAGAGIKIGIIDSGIDQT